MNGELSTTVLPLEAGNTFTIYVAGEGLDRIPASGISITSPFITVNQSTVTEEQFDTPYPVVSFQVTVDPYAPAGDYSIRLQSDDGEFVYLGRRADDRSLKPPRSLPLPVLTSTLSSSAIAQMEY